MSRLTFGEFVKFWRIERDLSQRVLAKAAGTSPAYLSKIETGEADNPSAWILGNLADALNVPRDILLNKALEVEGDSPPHIGYVPAYIFDAAQSFSLEDWRALEAVVKHMQYLRAQAGKA